MPTEPSPSGPPSPPPRPSEALFRAVFDGAAFGLVLMDPAGRLLDVNDAVVRKFGRRAGPLHQTSLDSITHPEDLERSVALREALVRGERTHYVTEQRLRHRDGRYLWVRLGVSAVRGATGEPEYLIAVGLDITPHRQSEERFRTVVESLGEGLVMTDLDDVVLYVNSRLTELTGYSAEELLGKPAYEVLLPRERWGLARDRLAERRRGVAGLYEVEHQLKDGSRRPFQINGVPFRDGSGEIVGTLALVQDISERKRVEEALRESEARYRRVVESVREVIFQTDAQGRWSFLNRAWKEITGFSVRESLGRSFAQYVHPADDERSRGLVESLLRGEKRSTRHEIRFLTRGGGFRWVEVQAQLLTDPDGRALGATGTLSDITGRRLIEERLRHDALHDALTGLPNRLLFMERLSHAAQRAKRREDYLFAVLFLDLDRFKVVNDSLGHHVGDELLVVVARRLRHCLRTEDTVARLGGDEFAILLEDIQGVGDAICIAERIQVELSTPVDLGGFDVFTSASVGIALSSTASERPEYLLRNADVAMYRAKAGGTARFEVFDREMHAQALARLQLETDLRRALERGEFRVHYQPIVSLAGGSLWGVEALVRWAHPERGLLAPDDFIPAAEETGMILPLGRWVLRTACGQVRQWQCGSPELAPIGLAVNLSTRQFTQPDLVEQVRQALEETGLAPERLRLEITESAAMQNAAAASALLSQLKLLGVQLSLDDFGTGYSSLSYLHRFPLDALKIDRSFVESMRRGERGPQLIRTILALARSLNVSVVAEGIETREQLDALQRMKCEFGQGYFFSEPVPPEALRAALESYAELGFAALGQARPGA